MIVSQYMFPERNATGELLTSLGTGLVANGFAVTAYCAQPTYYVNSKPVERKLNYEGVNIQRVWTTRFGRARWASRLADAVTFAISVAFWLLRLPRGAIVLSVTNPPFVPVMAAIQRLGSRTRFVLLVHDVFPEAAVQLGAVRPRGPIHRLLKLVDRLTLMQADSIVALGEDMQAILRAKLPSSRHDRVVVIPNWADGTSIVPTLKSRSRVAQRDRLLDTFVVQYSGNIGMSQGLEIVLKAAQQLQGDNVTFTIIGEGVSLQRFKGAVAARSLNNIRFFPRVPNEDLADSLAACDVALVPLAQGMEGLSVPSKYYAALASGRPVLAVMDQNAEVARSVLENDCGLVVAPSDDSGLVEAVRRLRNDADLRGRMGRNARLALERRYTRERALSDYTTVLRNLDGPHDSDQPIGHNVANRV